MDELKEIMRELLNQQIVKFRFNYDFDQLLPDKIPYILICDVSCKKYTWLKRDYRKGEIVYLYPNFDEDLLHKRFNKHLKYINPTEIYLLPEHSLLQLAFNN